MRADELAVRAATDADREPLAGFSCSAGEPWEDRIEEQIRGPLISRYLSSPPYFDGRLLLGVDPVGALLVVGAHHIEPSLLPDVGYTELVAVALKARGTLVELPQGERVSLGHFMLLVIFAQMRRLGRHPAHVRADRSAQRAQPRVAGPCRAHRRATRPRRRARAALGRAALTSMTSKTLSLWLCISRSTGGEA